jgi:NAD(P)-dependent dehydrogenase (short-subunit alcohol dehydrogenase family)
MDISSDMSGKVCLVTGANSGIGKEIALGLAKLNAKVVLVCRNTERGQAALAEIQHKSGSSSLAILYADLSSQVQIRKLADDFKRKYSQLHVLVNNAGVIIPDRCLTEDGVEMTFAVNYLAYFLLTNLVLDVLLASAPSRVVNITSAAHRGIHLDFNNLQGEKNYSRDTAYAQSKLAEIVFTYELARRLEGTRVPLYLASSQEVQGLTCKYFQTKQHLRLSSVNCSNTIAASSRESYDKEIAEKLWEISSGLTGLGPLKPEK